MANNQSYLPFPSQFFTNAGAPLSGGTITFYQAGSSSTLQNTYSDAALTVPNPNPITLNSAGFPEVSNTEVQIYPIAAGYHVVVKDSGGTTIHDWDHDNPSSPFNLVIPFTVSGMTSGGVLYGASTTSVASSALLAQYGPVIGGGAGNPPVSVTAGTANQIFVGNTSANPSFRAMTISDMPILARRVTADVTATTSTLATVTDLSVNVLGSTSYKYVLHLLFGAVDATGGIKVGLAGTATVTSLRLSYLAQRTDGTPGTLLNTQTNSTTLASNTASATGAGFATSSMMDIQGTIAVNAAGTLLFQFSQSSANGSSVLSQNSYLELTPLSN